MAQVYRPTYIEADPQTGRRIKKKSRTWHIRYYTPDGQRHRVKGYRDKKATETLAAELERRGIRLAAGIVDPTDEHAKTPLAEHLADYVRYLTAKGDAPKHVRQTETRARAALDACRFIRMADLQSSTLLAFLAELRTGGKSVKTTNEYLASVKGFTRWLWRDKRLVADPLTGLSRLATKGDADLRHARRDLSPDELRRLLATARTSPLSLGRLCGIDRYFLYLTAAATGFRAGELKSLKPESFDLTSESATVTVQASCTKNRREAVQPLPADVAQALAGWLREKTAGERLWPGQWRGWRMMKADLRTTREQWLAEAAEGPERERRELSDFMAYRDREGRYADFHALRHSYITAVGKTGASAKVHQELARHSTYAMTGRYTHARLHDLAATVAAMPSLLDGPKAVGRHGNGRNAREKTWPKP